MATSQPRRAVKADWMTGNQTISAVRSPTSRSTLSSLRLRSTLAQRLALRERVKPARPITAISQKTRLRLRSMVRTMSMSAARVLDSIPSLARASLMGVTS